MVQVQVRMPEKSVQEIDKWVAGGRFASRSDAIKTIVAMHQEREHTREFYKLLLERSRESREKPEILLLSRGSQLSFGVFLHPKAARFLKKAEPSLRRRIREDLVKLTDSPEERGNASCIHPSGGSWSETIA